MNKKDSDILNAINNYTFKSIKHSDIEKQDLFAQIESKINSEVKVRKINFKNLYKISAIAAVFILVMTQMINQITDPFSYFNTIGYQVIITQKGDKTDIVLPDNTKVKLNSDSKIKYKKEFKQRDVYLLGEAFFDVTRNTKKPFAIETQKTVTKVLGTSFNIKAYQNEVITTSVKTGLVSFCDKKQKKNEVLLKPNNKGSLSLNNNLTSSNCEIDHHIGWMNNKFVFENETLENIFKDLSRTYNVEFEFKNKDILNSKFTGKFNNESIIEIIDALSLTGKFAYTKDKNNFIIK